MFAKYVDHSVTCVVDAVDGRWEVEVELHPSSAHFRSPLQIGYSKEKIYPYLRIAKHSGDGYTWLCCLRLWIGLLAEKKKEGGDWERRARFFFCSRRLWRSCHNDWRALWWAQFFCRSCQVCQPFSKTFWGWTLPFRISGIWPCYFSFSLLRIVHNPRVSVVINLY